MRPHWYVLVIVSSFSSPYYEVMSTISSTLHTFPINQANWVDRPTSHTSGPYYNEDYINLEWWVQISSWVMDCHCIVSIPQHIDKKLKHSSFKELFDFEDLKLEQWQSMNQRRQKIIESRMLTPTPPWQCQKVNGHHCPNCKYSSSFWLCFRSLLQAWSSILSSINLYEKLALLKEMIEKLVITLVLSCVNNQFLIHIQSNKSYSTQESVFFLAESSTVVIWGSLSDRFGRRPILLLGPLGLSFSMLFFGTSTTYVPLVISRFCQGLFNGCVGGYIA